MTEVEVNNKDKNVIYKKSSQESNAFVSKH